MYEQPQWGTVNLGVDVLQGHGEQSQPGRMQYQNQHPNIGGKQQFNPGRNQELNLPPESFRSQKFNRENPFAPEGKMVPVQSIHERIKELLGEGWPRRQAIIQARQEARKNDVGDVGTITNSEIMNKKYRAETPAKKISPWSDQVQGYPFL